MFLNSDYIEPSELTGFARGALADLAVNQFTLSRFLPDREIDDIDYRFTRGGEGLAEAATFRNYDAPSRFGSRPGAVRVSGQLPPISRQIRLGEYDRLKARKAGDDAVVNAIFDDARRMTRAVAARMELARGEALVTGKVAINEGGVVATADYGRAAGHTVTAGTLWTNTAASTPLTNLVAWCDTVEAATGSRPVSFITSRARQRNLQQNAEIINAVKGSAAGVTRVSETELNDLLNSEGIPSVETYDVQVNVAGVATRPIAADRVVLIAGGEDLGATLWGTTAESMETEYGIEESEWPGIVAGVYKSPNPLAFFTNAVGIGLPVLANPDLTFCADVA